MVKAMTEINIYTLKAGRDADALVGKHVFGYGAEVTPPAWSTDTLHAICLWSRLSFAGWTCTLAHRQFEKHPDDRWIFHGVLLITPEPPNIMTQRFASFSAHADTMEFAIVRGVLAALEASNKAEELAMRSTKEEIKNASADQT